MAVGPSRDGAQEAFAIGSLGECDAGCRVDGVSRRVASERLRELVEVGLVRPALPDHMADLFDRPERYDVLPADPAAIRAHVERCVSPG